MAWSGRHVVVTLPTEIDTVNSADVITLLSEAAGQGTEVMTGDLSGTTFCDSAGVQAIARGYEQAAANGTELRLAVGDSPVARILQLAGLDQVIPVYRHVQQSLDTAPAGLSPPPGEPGAGPARRPAAGRDVLVEMQHALLPAVLPVLPQARIAARYLMAGQDQAAGGDWFDAVPLPGGRVALAVGDMVGHGVAAAAAMGQLRAALNELLTAEHELTAVLARADAFAARIPALSAATLALAVLHPGDGRLQYATCGHPPPLIVSPTAAPRFLASTGAGPLGTGAGPGARPLLASAQLHPGELVLLYTDGLIARPGSTPLEGMAELAKVAADAAAGQILPSDPALTSADRVSQLTMALLTRSGYADDVTTLAAERHAAGPELDLELPGEVGTVRAARRAFSGWLSQLDPLLLDQDALLLATTEIVTNAVEHAYSAGPPGPVEFHARLGADGQLECRVADHGSWQVPDPDLPWRGQGLMVAAHLVDQLQVQHPPQSVAEARGAQGTVVTLRHRLRRPAVLAAEPAAQAAAYGADPPFSVAAGLDGPAARATVRGPVDSSTAGRLAGQLLAASRGGTLPLTVDLSAVTQLASAGVRALYQVKEQLNDYHQELTLVAAPGSLADAALGLAGLPVVSGSGDAMERPPGG